MSRPITPTPRLNKKQTVSFLTNLAENQNNKETVNLRDSVNEARERRKKTRVLVNDPNLVGKYVVFRSFNDSVVIAFDADPKCALKKAQEAGVETPVIVYVPKEDEKFV